MAVNYLLLLIPLISALIGWFTNWLAIRMLFRPIQPSWFLGFQGVIPKRQAELAKSIGHIVETELVSHHDIAQALLKPEYIDAVVSAIECKVEQALLKYFGALPLFQQLIQTESVQKIKQSHLSFIRNEIELIMRDFLSSAEQKIEISELVEKKILALSIPQLEELVRNIAAKELKAVEIVGGVVGFLVGLVQLLIISLS